LLVAIIRNDSSLENKSQVVIWFFIMYNRTGHVRQLTNRVLHTNVCRWSYGDYVGFIQARFDA